MKLCIAYLLIPIAMLENVLIDDFASLTDLQLVWLPQYLGMSRCCTPKPITL